MGIFMKLRKIHGDATQIVPSLAGDLIRKPGQETGWIPLDSFRWTIDSTITTKSGPKASSNRGPKNPKLSEITVAKTVDLSSVELLRTLCRDEDGQDCAIVFMRTGDPGIVYLQYDLKNTLIKQIVLAEGTKGDARPTETLQLTFTDITMHVWQTTEENVNGLADHHPIHNDARDAAAASPPGSGGQGAHAPQHPGSHPHS
jgi:type VI protein secretion system component Hcp